MTNRGLAVLGLRLLALMIVVFWVARMPEIYLALASRELDWLLVVLLCLPLALATLLWFQVGPMVQLILPQRTAQGEPEPLTGHQAQVIAFAAVGCLLLIGALPELLRAAFVVHSAYQPVAGLAAIEAAKWVGLAAPAIQFGLGGLLLLRGEGMVRWLTWLRRAGVAKSRLGALRGAPPQ